MKSVNSYSERIHTPDIALSLFEKEIQNLALTASFYVWGERDLKTYHCVLRNSDGEDVSHGSGKGLGLQSKVSAAFEAIEHYAMYVRRSYPSSAHTPKELRDQGVKLVSDGLSAPIEEWAQLADKYTHWVKFMSVDNLESVSVPAFLVDPDYWNEPRDGEEFNTVEIESYISTNGGASGCVPEEALLHALNEQIERHAQGAFLFEAFVSSRKEALLVDPKTLPAHLVAIKENIESIVGAEVFLFYMPDNFGVPAFFTSADFLMDGHAVYPSGAGASLSAEYAAERAYLELLQDIHFMRQRDVPATEIAELEGHQELFRDWPEIQKCLRRNLASACKSGDVKTTKISFKDCVIDLKLNLSRANASKVQLSEQIVYIDDALKKAGLCAYYANLFQSQETGLSYTRVLIPEMDNTWLILNGIMVEPNFRACTRFEKK